MSRVVWSDMGRMDYNEAYKLQQGLRGIVRNQSFAGVLLFVEHPPTITLGYSLKGDEGRAELKSGPDVLDAQGIRVIEVDRGGKATYHGPGQVVGYPILHLRSLGLGTKRYVTRLERMLIKSLDNLEIKAERDPRYPGVWVDGSKIAAIGVHISERVTTHGFALNLEPELAHFGHIVPCGIADRGVTSIAKLTGQAPARQQVIRTLVQAFAEQFNTEMPELKPAEIRQIIDEGVCQ